MRDLSAGDMNDLSQDEIDWQVKTIKHALDFDLDLVIPNPRAVSPHYQNVVRRPDP